MSDETVEPSRGEPAPPLAGVRILAVEHMLSMPYATQLLALMGADVLKVEPVDGEPSRQSRPTLTTTEGLAFGSTFMRANLAKRSLAVNLKDPKGREIVLRLAREFDVVAENMRPGVMDSLGLGYGDLSAVKPDLIMVSLSGFGNHGVSPYRNWPAYAPTVDSTAGLYEWGRGQDEAPRIGSLLALGDIGAGIFAAIGTLAAIVKRERTGRGEHVDVAMADTSLAINDAAPLEWAMDDGVTMATGVGLSTAFRADDGYFAVTIVRPYMFHRFADVVGRPEWKDDPRLADRSQWDGHLEGLIRPAVESWAGGRSKLDAARTLAGAGVAAGPCNDGAAIVSDPHYAQRGILIDTGLRSSNERAVKVTGVPISFLEPFPTEDLRWPGAGEHSAEILAAIGFDPEEIATLASQGIVGGVDR